MGRARIRRARRRSSGLVPRLARAAWAACQWAVRRPQPVLAAGLLAGAVWGLVRYTQAAGAFRIARVLLPAEPPLKLPRALVGESVWALDIRSLADELSAQQPSLKEVRVIRQLPQTIRVVAIPRRPVAQVRLGSWYLVDQDGFILPDASAQPRQGLIRLVGFERGGTVRAGRANSDERLRLSLRVLGLLRRAPVLISRRVTEVNVGDPQQIRFLINDDTEVRCGSEEELSAHLERLRSALKTLTREHIAAQYIDVRFQEPVVGPRT
jgi:cell division septal protein FtsQ